MARKMTATDVSKLGDIFFKAEAPNNLSPAHIKLFRGKWMSSVTNNIMGEINGKTLNEKQLEEISRRGLTELIKPDRKRSLGEKLRDPVLCYAIDVSYEKPATDIESDDDYDDGRGFTSLSIFTLLWFREDGFMIEHWNVDNIDFLFNYYNSR